MNKSKNSSITSFFSTCQSNPDRKRKKKSNPNTSDSDPISVSTSKPSKTLRPSELDRKSPKTRHLSLPRITIDLTLDSPTKPSSTSSQPIHKPPTDNSNQSVPPTGLKTFSDFDRARRQKLKNNSKPTVYPAWPSHHWVHQRFLDLEHYQIHGDQTSRELPKRKGKRPIRTAYPVLEEDQEWLKNIGTTCINIVDCPHIPGPSPTLNRLNLQPPINLLPEVNEHPVYQHPLLQRLLGLLRCPEGAPMTYDHPTLCRQHHRPPDSLNQLWTTKYAPHKASEILGDENVQSAQTLKSWLLEIALKEAHHSSSSFNDQLNTSDQMTGPKKGSKRQTNKQKKMRDTQKPKRIIIRSVAPPKRKSRRLLDSDEDSDGLKDFIVSDEESDDDTIYARDVMLSESEGQASCSPRRKRPPASFLNPELAPVPELNTPNSPHHQDAAPTIKFNNLTNLILLRGPHGTGKSSAVQAVAEELGWEVFEVNPGVLRTRRELDRLIGDVSRNHVISCSSKPSKSKPSRPHPSFFPDSPAVSNLDLHQSLSASEFQSKPASKAVNPFAKMMKATQEKTHVSKPKRKIEELDDHDDEDLRSEKHDQLPFQAPHQPRANNQTKQSLILLEEVDVVYGQDKEFWSGVIELVSKSMRPIVMTCNDDSVLPLESLPIQMILEFSPPPAELVSRFLQMICLIEGHFVDPHQLEKFYLQNVYHLPPELRLMGHNRSDNHLLEIFQEPARASHDPDPDLRRSMTQLQFFCQWAVGSRYLGVDWLDLADDKSSKMLFCSNSLPSSSTDRHPLLHLTSQAPQSDPSSQQSLFDRLGDRVFQVDWFQNFVSQHPNQYPSSPVESQDKNVADLTHFPSESEGLDLLAKAHEDLSFGDAFVDKGFEIELDQFESEIPFSVNDNVIINSNRPNNPAIETKKQRTTIPADYHFDEDYYDYDLQYQHLHPRRPSSSSHLCPEKDLFHDICSLVFRHLSGPVPSPSPPLALGLHQCRPHYHSPPRFLCLWKFFKVFNHDELVKIRARNLKEMDEYMSFEGSRGFLLPMKEYILDYNGFIKLIFGFDRANRLLDPRHQADPAGVSVLRKSSRLTQPLRAIHPPTHIPVLVLDPSRIRAFLSLSKNLPCSP